MRSCCTFSTPSHHRHRADLAPARRVWGSDGSGWGGPRRDFLEPAEPTDRPGLRQCASARYCRKGGGRNETEGAFRERGEDRFADVALPGRWRASESCAPSLFAVVGPFVVLRAISILVLIPGVIGWAWSVVLILTRVPQRRLIIEGPYAWVKHPLYTGVAFLVLPWIGFLFNTWLGVVIGIALYVGSRVFSPEGHAFPFPRGLVDSSPANPPGCGTDRLREGEPSRSLPR